MFPLTQNVCTGFGTCEFNIYHMGTLKFFHVFKLNKLTTLISNKKLLTDYDSLKINKAKPFTGFGTLESHVENNMSMIVRYILK